MANDNGNGMWELIQQVLLDAPGSDVTPDQVAVEVSRRDPGLWRENEGWTEFLRRVVDLLEKNGCLNGCGPGASVKALTTQALRESADLSLDGPGQSRAEAAALMLGTPSHGWAAGGHARPPAAVPDRTSAELSMLAWASEQAAARAEEERAAAVLLGERGR
jgi:hypothetical protein